MGVSTEDFSEGKHMIDICLLLSDAAPEQLFSVSPSGHSMFPFFAGTRDTLFVKKSVFPLKRGDIALYKRANGTCVVHRVHHVNTANSMRSYYMLGDNQVEIEGPLLESQIFGVVSHYIRKGKTIDCSSPWYHFLWWIWMLLRPFRPLILRIWQIIHKKLHGD